MIVVPGGGLLPNGNLPNHSNKRVDKAIELYKQVDGNAIIIVLSAGTTHKPNPVDSKGFPITEADAAAKSLIQKGIPEKNVYQENISLDTIGNAYFLRVIHMEPARLNKLVVITNKWHMERTRAIFETVFSLPKFNKNVYHYKQSIFYNLF